MHCVNSNILIKIFLRHPPAAAPKTMIFRVSTDIFLPTKTGEGDGALVLLDVHIYSLRLYHLPLARGQRRP